MAIGVGGAAEAGPTAAQKCEGGKNQTSGKFAACVAKAEKGLVLKGDLGKYDSALTKCEDKLADGFTKLEAKDDCPSTGDAAEVQGYLDGCAQAVAQHLADGSPLPECEAGAGAALLETGQTTSYGAGSDGDLQFGAARSFTDNGDGTITDNLTGLMWEKKSDDGSIHDKDNTYTWSTGSNDMDGTIVTTLLATLNGDGGFAGHTDWRVPNLYELESLGNFGAASPATYPEFHNGCTGGCTVTECSCTRSSFPYWSSTTLFDAPHTAIFMHSVDASSDLAGKTFAVSVRAVRTAL